MRPRDIKGARVLVVLLIGGGLAACSGKEAPPTPEPRTVVAERVGHADRSRVWYSGTVRAADRSELAFEAGGQIAGIFVELGDRFARGDLLAELDASTLRLELAGRRADLANAEAVLVDSRLDYERRAGLAGTGAVSQSAIDQARSRFDSATAQVSALGAAVAQAEEALADAHLRAPFDGEVTARLAEPSEVVAGGEAVLSVIGMQASLETVIQVPGSVRPTLEVGTPGRIGAGGEPAQGRITEIGAQANTAGLFPVTLAIDEAPGWLRPGESIEAQFDRDGHPRTLVVPLTAFIPGEDRAATVYVVDTAAQQAAARARRVRLGELRDDGVEILDGLRPGELVVVRGVELLTDGQAIRVAGIGLARYNR